MIGNGLMHLKSYQHYELSISNPFSKFRFADKGGNKIMFGKTLLEEMRKVLLFQNRILKLKGI